MQIDEFPPGQCCQQTFIQALMAPGRESALYRNASARVRSLAQEALEGALDAHGLDALVMPTEPYARLIPAYGGYPAVRLAHGTVSGI
jgi:amidase